MWLKIISGFNGRLFQPGTGSKFQLCFTRSLSGAVKSLLEPKEEFTVNEKVLVRGYNINYLKIGTGPHVVFCFPGILGSMRSHLFPIIRGIDQEKFTLLVWDQPGYGFSRPPGRNFNNKTFWEDVHLAHDFMKILGFDKYSVMGWSGGGVSTLLFPILYPNSVLKIIPWGAWSFCDKEDAENFERVKDSNKYGGRMKDVLVEEYGLGFFEREWVRWMDIFISFHKEMNGEICAKELHKIHHPALIIHGSQDGLIYPKHGAFLHQNIPNSRFHLWDKGKHNVQLRYPEEFNALFQGFLLE